MTNRLCNYISICVILFFFISLTSCRLSSSRDRRELIHVNVIFARKVCAEGAEEPHEMGEMFEFTESNYNRYVDNDFHLPCDNRIHDKLFDFGVFLNGVYKDFFNSVFKEYHFLYVEYKDKYNEKNELFSGLRSGGLDFHDLGYVEYPSFWKECADVFAAEEERILEDGYMKAEIAKYEPLFAYATYKTGIQIRTPSQMARLYWYFQFIAEKLDASLPEWTKGYFPNGQMLDVTLLSNYIQSRSMMLKQVKAGGDIRYMLRFATDEHKFMSLYGRDDEDLAVLLQVFNSGPLYFVPEIGASIIFEYLHDKVDDVKGFEIFYYTGLNTNKTIQLTLPGCDVFCPLVKFYDILKDVIPTYYVRLRCKNKEDYKIETEYPLSDMSDMPNWRSRGILNDPAPLILEQPLYNELEQLHVIFAHKLNAPLESDIARGYPERLDYQWFLENTLEMTKESEKEVFNLGLLLRKTYGEFLGKEYYYEVMKMRTSEYFLSRISGHLVSKALWPPVNNQKWDDNINFQPIPIEYNKRANDTLFLGTLCPKFNAEMKLILQKESSKAEILEHEALFSDTTKNVGENNDNPSKIARLYSYIETVAGRYSSYNQRRSTGDDDQNHTRKEYDRNTADQCSKIYGSCLRNGLHETEPTTMLPQWTKSILPHLEMQYMRSLSYELMSKSKIQKQLNGGTFIKNITKDSETIINPMNELPVENKKKKRDFKISLYSGDERNLAGVLHAMNVWPMSYVPESGAAVIFELRHDNMYDIYGYKMFYYTGYKDNQTLPLVLPGCQAFCPFNKFTEILNDLDILPDEDEQLLCNTILPGKEKT